MSKDLIVLLTICKTISSPMFGVIALNFDRLHYYIKIPQIYYLKELNDGKPKIIWKDNFLSSSDCIF
jgi:hypothetical protein